MIVGDWHEAQSIKPGLKQGCPTMKTHQHCHADKSQVSSIHTVARDNRESLIIMRPGFTQLRDHIYKIQISPQDGSPKPPIQGLVLI